MSSKTTNLSLEKFDGGDYVDNDKINANYDILDKMGVDYVTEQSTSGSWTYRKFKSGIAECWAKIDIGVITGPTSGWVNVGQTFPITFSEAPVCNFNVGCDTTIEMHAMYIKTTTTNFDAWVKKYNQKALDTWIYVHAIGKV